MLAFFDPQFRSGRGVVVRFSDEQRLRASGGGHTNPAALFMPHTSLSTVAKFSPLA
jgi:hypothetical protein